MTIPLWCILGGAVLPYIWAGASVPFRNKQLGSLDLAQPRLQAASLTDGGAGAWGAQMNAWEALSIFLAANFLALATGVDAQGHWATASIIWLGSRVLHGVFYITGQATLRVASFVISIAMSLWIFGMAVSA